MKSHKNKNSNFCKKFLSSTLIILLMFSVNITAIPLTSADPPTPYFDFGKTIVEAIVEITKSLINKQQITETNVTNMINEAMTHVTDITYPVGSIYMSVSNENPATIFGGVWERWGAGRVPVGVNATQSEFSSVEQTGSEKTHTLTVGEMPSHQHVIPGATCCWGTGIKDVAYIPQSVRLGITGCNELHFSTTGDPINVQACGGEKPQSLLQPYITCYMWKRIA